MKTVEKLQNTTNSKDIFYDFISKRIPFTFEHEKDQIVCLNYDKFYKKITHSLLNNNVKVEGKKVVTFNEYNRYFLIYYQ